MNVLSLNLGSSSLKYAVHRAERGELTPVLARSASPSEVRRAVEEAQAAAGKIDAVGHRVVFGGERDSPAMVTSELLCRLESLQSLDPLHMPGAIAAIRGAQAALPGAAHVACFDTAFFHDLPRNVRTLAIPAADPLLRGYGFHGLSYEYVCRALGARLRPRTIAAHLGNGASVAALLDGKPVATTMAFSPLSGVIMSTRPGDLDPGLLLYLLERTGLTVPQLRDMLETQSGLRAISGGESDMRKLCDRDDDDAVLAVEMFVRSVSRAIAAHAVDLGGVELLIFTGGIGTHNERVRRMILARLRFLHPLPAIEVLETDENLTIAAQTLTIVQ